MASNVGIGTIIYHTPEPIKARYRALATASSPVLAPNATSASTFTQAPSLKLVGGLAVTPQAITTIPWVSTPDAGVAAVNERFFHCNNWGGRSTYVRQEPGGALHPCTREEIQSGLGGRKVQLPDGKLVPLAPFWLTSSGRREVDRIIYDPEGVHPAQGGERIHNLWVGLNRRARRGRCGRMLRHLWLVACRGNREHYNYLMDLLAHIVQHPGTAPGVVLVLRSKMEGTGKTTIADWMCSMLGRHAMMLNSPTQLLGRFNTHLEDKSLVVVNEPSWAGDHAAAAQLKSMITDPSLIIERKHGGVHVVPNILHYIFTTNADWAVPAGAGARRFFVLDVDPTKAGDHSYFSALHDEAANGGIEALLYVLLQRDLTRSNLRAVPVTDALREQQMRSLPPHSEWALDLVEREIGGQLGAAFGGHNVLGFGQPVSATELYADYCSHVAGIRGRPMSRVGFGRWLGRLGLSSQRGAARQWVMPAPDVFDGMVRQEAGVRA